MVVSVRRERERRGCVRLLVLAESSALSCWSRVDCTVVRRVVEGDADEADGIGGGRGEEFGCRRKSNRTTEGKKTNCGKVAN